MGDFGGGGACDGASGGEVVVAVEDEAFGEGGEELAVFKGEFVEGEAEETAFGAGGEQAHGGGSGLGALGGIDLTEGEGVALVWFVGDLEGDAVGKAVGGFLRRLPLGVGGDEEDAVEGHGFAEVDLDPRGELGGVVDRGWR